MIVPVKNIVEQVDLTSDDVLLPMLECVVNSIISLQQSKLPKEEKKIQIQITRGNLPQNQNIENLKTISSFKVIDNGVGFNKNNFKSFETPFSQINKDFGCKGIGRFTVLDAFEEYFVKSNFKVNGKWYNRVFQFTKEKEIEKIVFEESKKQEYKTVIEINNCNNPLILEKSAVSLAMISESIMQHCLIYYLNKALPLIEIIDTENDTGEVINQLFERVSKDKEREFEINKEKFKLYITKTLKEGNRKNNYLYYCANSRTVGNGKNLKNINGIFTYPVLLNGNNYFFDIYLVSEYLNPTCKKSIKKQ